MAGGRGERLQPLTAGLPKPLVPLFDRPLLGYLIQHLLEHGVEEIFVTAGYRGEQIRAYLAGFPADARLHCHTEERPRGTAGAVADLRPRLRSPFLVVSGDAILDLDLPALLGAHQADGNMVTICLAPLGERLRFGTVALTGRRIRHFVEKPPLADLLPEARINTGCYVMQTEALADVPGEGLVDFALHVFPSLLARGYPLGAVAGARFWRDIGTLEAYREAHFEGLNGTLPWSLAKGTEPVAAASAQIRGPVHFGSGVRIEAGARIVGPAVLGEGCRVGRGAEVVRSILLAGSAVAAGVVLRDCVVDLGARVPAGWRLAGAGVAGWPAAGARSVGRVRRAGAAEPAPGAKPVSAPAAAGERDAGPFVATAPAP